jgi:gliding motility-associated-like protein
VKDRTALYFPNAFTPNGDGLNDIFKPVGIYITNYHLQIFDRAGRAVFYSGDPEHGWDGYIEGGPAQEGVYVWICTFTHDYGDNLVKDLKLKGTVTLIR